MVTALKEDRTMRHNTTIIFILAWLPMGIADFIPSDICHGQSWQEQAVAQSKQLLDETMARALSRIPQAMLTDAHGVALIPNVVKGGFIVGARFGRGVLMIREPNGSWHAPVFITLTGGNVGWQAGVQSSDIILVFKSPRSIQGVLNGKVTLGADMAAAAGPVGRQGGVATDGQLRAEIYTYSRSRGLFAGVAIDGSVLQVDRIATGNYYGITGTNTTPIVPPAAQQLTEAVARYAETIASGAASTPALPQQVGAGESELIRTQLAQLSPRLFDILDDSWKNYLGLPSWMFAGGPPADPNSLREVVARYDSVARDPRFAQLASRPEFQSVYGLLKHYEQSIAPNSVMLQLPPPPITSG
jgi:lipid-binding SYLF domain-containing protein